MQANFDPCYDFTMAKPDDGQPFHVTTGDPGGATSWGVTIATWARWMKRPVSLDEMKALTQADVKPLYNDWYWLTVGCDKLPIGVDLMVFDHGVMSGEGETAVALQDVLRVDTDGHVGPLTLAAAQAIDPVVLIGKLAWRQEQHYRAASDAPSFINGWIARLDRRVTAAMAMRGQVLQLPSSTTDPQPQPLQQAA